MCRIRSMLAVAVVVAFILPWSAFAAMHEVVSPAAKGKDVYWWPVLPAVAGWKHDEATSRILRANVLVPVGQVFADAPAVMYAKALSKSRLPMTKSLAQLVADDRREFARKVPGVKVADMPAVRTADGKTLLSLEYTPAGKGSWERVAYGEEGHYFLVFTVSAQNDASLKAALPAFSRLVSHYQAHP